MRDALLNVLLLLVVLGLSHQLAGDEWSAMPWRVLVPWREQWAQLPTFLLCEWCYRLTCWAALAHAVRTDRVKSWCCGWLCGTANDIFFMFMPFCDNFWQAQATVMITPRLPLYIVEMYASVMYYPAVAASVFARWAHIPPFAQACLAGLLAHVFYGVYDVNGPKHLWWTWHDGDPAIRERAGHAPLGSSLWILTYCGLQSFLNAWMLRGPGATLRGSVPPSVWDLGAVSNLRQLLAAGRASPAAAPLLARLLPHAAGPGPGGGPGGGAAERALLRGAALIDALQAALNKAPDAVQIGFRCVVATPLFMVLMGVGQVLSLDLLGIPGRRTYALTLGAMVAVVARAVRAGRATVLARDYHGGGGQAARRKKSGLLGSGLPAAYAWPNRVLFVTAVCLHFSLFTAVNILGVPAAHVSTGIHQVRSFHYAYSLLTD